MGKPAPRRLLPGQDETIGCPFYCNGNRPQAQERSEGKPVPLLFSLPAAFQIPANKRPAPYASVPSIRVPTGSPRTALRMFSSWAMANTKMGMFCSLHRVMAVRSVAFKSAWITWS